MKKILSITMFLILCSPWTISQEINESFLASLPESLQNELLKGMSEPVAGKDLQSNIQSPDTRIKNLEDALLEAEQTLTQIRREVELENSTISFNFDEELKSFGDNFFRSYQSTFLPVNEVSISGEYMLDIQDVLMLQLTGLKNQIYDLTILRDGSINIPGVGKIQIIGLAYDQAVKLIEDRVSNTLMGVTAYITLKKLSDINVLIIGNIKKPGMYTLAGSSSPLNLIDVAGGISSNGSYRKILHKRSNVVLQSIDLYDVIINGNLQLKHSLRSGDVLVVAPKIKEVSMSGGFINQAKFELLEEENLSDLIRYAGLKQNVSKFISIERLNKNGLKESLKINYIDNPDFSILAGDSLSIALIEPSFKTAKRINVTGQVNIPGEYVITDKMTLHELLTKAGGFTETAYPLGGVFTRESIKLAEIKYKERSYNELASYIIASPNFSSGSGISNPETLLAFIQILEQYKPSGRIVTEFDLGQLERKPELNRFLQDGDRIHIPHFNPEIHVFGEVVAPGSINYKSKLTVKDYIDNAGGFTKLADPKRVIVVSPNGQTKLYSQSTLSLFSSKDDLLMPGSTIYTPREIGKMDGISLAGSIAPLVSSLALSLASLNSISNWWIKWVELN